MIRTSPVYASLRRLLSGLAAVAVGLGAALVSQSVLAQAAGKPDQLVLYTSQPEKDVKRTLDAFAKVHPGIKVEVFRSGTTEVINKLNTEFAAGAPRPDVLLIADAVTMEDLKAQGRLARMRNVDTSAVPAAFFDAQRTYVGTKLITTGIVYNTRSPVKPKAWKDLLDPALKAQVVMPSPLYSGAAAITIGAWSKTPALGWPFIEGLKSNGATAVRGNGAVLQQVATGEKMVGVVVDFMALNAKAKGSPVEFVVPAEGLTFVTEPAAILNTAKNPEAAEMFINFLISREGQKFATTLGYFPVVKGIAPPAGFPDEKNMRYLKLDSDDILKSADADKKRFSAAFGG